MELFMRVGKYLPNYTASRFVVIIVTATTILETSCIYRVFQEE